MKKHKETFSDSNSTAQYLSGDTKHDISCRFPSNTFVPPNNTLFGGTVPLNKTLFGRTLNILNLKYLMFGITGKVLSFRI